MRLIDADALTEDCKRYLGTLNPDRDGKECTRIHWLIGVLANASTIEPERKTGKWIEDAEIYYKAVNEKGGGVDENTPYFTEDYIACSECLAMFSVIDNCTEDFDFCPKCGAMMQEREEENR